ncbi:MAG: hypothetical protein JXQ73_17155 [Phycisphaerae bacterium]|nr:hypothetical protein [Phycisphaerae bacterium]
MIDGNGDGAIDLKELKEHPPRARRRIDQAAGG